MPEVATAPADLPDFASIYGGQSAAVEPSPGPSATPDFSSIYGSPTPSPPNFEAIYADVTVPEAPHAATELAKTPQVVIPRMGTMGTETNLLGLDANTPQPDWFPNMVEGAGEAGMAMAPKSVGDFVSMFVPPEQTYQGAKELYSIARDVVDGTPIDEAVLKNSPDVAEIRQAAQTPNFSKERFTVGFKLAGQAAMLAGGVKALKGKPNASQITSTTSLPIPEVRQGMGGETSLRQSGAPAGTRPTEGETQIPPTTETAATGAVRQDRPDLSEGNQQMLSALRNQGMTPEREAQLFPEPTGVTETLAELDRRNGRAAQLPTPENKGLGLPPPEAPVPEELPATAPEPIIPVKGTGRFRRSYQYGQDVGDSMNALAAAGESGSLRGVLGFRSVTQGLTKEQIADLGNYLVSERLKTVNPFHPQILSEAETAQILSNPKIAEALKRYRDTIKPDIEALRKRAGLTEEQAAGKSEEFISLIPESDEMLPEKPAPAGNVPIRVQSKTTRFARVASGNASRYSTDLRNILSTSYSEVLKKTRLRDFYGLIKEKGLASEDPAEGFSVPNLKGEAIDHPAEAVGLGRAKAGAEGSGLPGIAWLPRDLAIDLRDVLEKPPTSSSPLGKAVGFLQRTTTGLALTANPAEVVNHMRRQFQVAAGKPVGGVNPAIRIAEAAIPYIGPKIGTFARVISTDMNLPVNQAILQDLFDAGGGSTRAFSQYQSKIRGLKQVQAFTKDLMFSIPEGKGIKGWDLRMRVQMEKIRRAIEGNSSPQRMRDFANQLGQYGNKPDWHIDALRKVNPYAATTLPLRVAEMRQVLGGSGLKGKSLSGKMVLRVETFLRGTGGTLLGLMAANQLLSGHYPWENEAGHEFDLDTGMTDTDGKRIFVKLRAIAPELARPINTFSLPQLSKESTAGDNADYVSAGLIGPANQVLQTTIGSPLVNTAMAATTGLAPYFTKQPGKAPELLDIARSKEHSRGAQQLIEASRQLNPTLNAMGSIGDLAGDEDEEGKYRVQLEPLRSLEIYGPLGSIFAKGSKPTPSKPAPHTKTTGVLKSHNIKHKK